MEAIILSKNQRKRANRRARQSQKQNQLVVYEQPQNSVSLQQVQKVSLPGQGTSRSARRRRNIRQKSGGGGRRGGQTGTNLYLASLIDPENNPGAKIPDMVTFPSATIQMTADGIAGPTGTGDGCAIIVNPILGTPDATTAFPIYRGSNAISGNDYSWTNVPWANGVTIRTLFDTYRPVSAVLYAEFIGASTNDAGQICMGMIPRTGAATPNAIENLARNFTVAVAQSFTKTIPLRNGAVITWKPQDNVDLEYKFAQSNTAADHQFPLIFFCTAGQAVGVTIRYRVVVNFELIPTTDTSTFLNPTPSHSNMNMLEQAINWTSQTYNNMSAFVSTVSPYVQPALNNMVASASALGLTYMNNRLASGRGNTLRILN